MTANPLSAAAGPVAAGPSGSPGSRRRRVLAAAVGAVLLLIVASLAVGAHSLSVDQVWQALRHRDDTDATSVIVWQLRWPRTVIAVAAGVALGVAGALMQGLTRNPLADPGLLGVNAGAALAVVTAIAVFGVAAPSGYVWFALLGAALAAVAVYALAGAGRSGPTPVALALAGAGLTALLQSVITLFVLRDNTTFDQFRLWEVGAVAGRDLGTLAAVAPFLVAGLLLAAPCGRLLNTLAMGEDVARGLGMRVGRVRAVAAVAVVLLCGGATALAGPIAFVGLAVPHLARLVAGADQRWVLGLSAVLAPALLLAADVLGRVVARPGEVQVGVMTALLGAPVLVALVRRRRVAL